VSCLPGPRRPAKLRSTRKNTKTYESLAWKTLGSVRDYLSANNAPVILLEGTRQLPDNDRPSLVALGQLLATELPQAVFRTGNATGTDTAFAEGVARVDARRLQFVIPQTRMGRSRIPPLAYTVSLEQLTAQDGDRYPGQ
jgi:hypothetical protein